MAPKTEELTHEEIWDDSALVDSWNDALEEYKVCNCYQALKKQTNTVSEISQRLCQGWQCERYRSSNYQSRRADCRFGSCRNPCSRCRFRDERVWTREWDAMGIPPEQCCTSNNTNCQNRNRMRATRPTPKPVLLCPRPPDFPPQA